MNDIIIIGGGIGGLYTAYKLIEKYPNKSIKILEKQDYFGGRIFTYHDRLMNVEAGAGRFNTKNKHLMKLIDELGLSSKKLSIPTDFKIIDQNNPGVIEESRNDDIIKKVLQNIKETDTYLQNLTFMDYAKKKVSKKDIDYLHGFFGYTSELTEMNAYDAIQVIKTYFMSNIKYYILKGGLSQLVEKLVTLLKSKGVQLIKNREITNIENIDNSFELTCKDVKTKYKCETCICAVTKNVLEEMQIFNVIKKYLKYIVGKPLCRIYSRFSKDVWFKDLPKITMNNKIRYMIPVDKEKGIIMISYTDNIYANYWERIYNKEGIDGINKKHKSIIKKTFNIDIPEPDTTEMFYWDFGVAFLKPGFDSKTMPQKIMQPYEDKKLFVCGENYSPNNTAWIEGALDTSEYILKKI